MSHQPGDLTLLFQQWQAGEEGALDALMDEVYTEIRKMARSQLQGERQSPTLQATDLANDVFLRLVKLDRLDPKSREFFFGIVKRLMRNLLIDRSRKKTALKRGAGDRPLPLDGLGDIAAAPGPRMSSLDAAMEELRATRPLQAEILNLRVFCGLTHAETAQQLGIAQSKVRREWTAARQWLEDRLDAAQS